MINNFLTLPPSFGIGNFQITFYSIFILTGALLALFNGMYRLKKLGYDPHRLENVFLIAFPAGLIGARIWYIICQWHEFSPAFKESFWAGLSGLFGITDHGIQIAGLAIEGGVFLGIVAGVLFVLYRRKEMNALRVADAVIPGILLAQAVGRWGNFFNREVYGAAMDPAGWSWLGTWFVDQMTIDGAFRTPLFLIESLINIGGFLFLTYVFANPHFKKYIAPGSSAAWYFIWYGTVRAILEPLRDPKYIMSGYISVTTSIVFVVFGLLLLLFFNLYRFYLKKHFKLHLFDRRVGPSIYVDYATEEYIDQDCNVIPAEKINLDKYGDASIKVEEEVEEKKESKMKSWFKKFKKEDKSSKQEEKKEDQNEQ